MSEPRLPYQQLAPKSTQALLALSLEPDRRRLLGERLVGLVNLRVSQINGCGFCVDMHWAELHKHGMELRHINAVAAWREAPFFSERERAALHWAEKVALIPQTDPDDAAYAALQAHFSPEEVAALGYSIAVITAWNLLNVSSRHPVPAGRPAV